MTISLALVQTVGVVKAGCIVDKASFAWVLTAAGGSRTSWRGKMNENIFLKNGTGNVVTPAHFSFSNTDWGTRYLREDQGEREKENIRGQGQGEEQYPKTNPLEGVN